MLKVLGTIGANKEPLFLRVNMPLLLGYSEKIWKWKMELESWP